MTLSSPLTRSRLRSHISKIPTYFCQTDSSPSPHFHILHLKCHHFFTTDSKLEHDSSQRRMKREDWLRLASRTYYRFTRRIRSIPLSLPSKHFSRNMPLRPSSFSRSSVSHCQRMLVLQLVYTAHTCHDQVHSCVARVRTLTEFRSTSIEAYPIQCYHDGKWVKVQTNELLPGDVVSLGECLCSPKEFLY